MDKEKITCPGCNEKLSDELLTDLKTIATGYKNLQEHSSEKQPNGTTGDKKFYPTMNIIP